MPALFVTGATGLVGRRVLARLDPAWFSRVTCLSRGLAPRGAPDGVAWVRGDVGDPGSYAHRLGPDTMVLHLAAATGNVPAAVHRAVNVLGTAALLKACTSAGVSGLVYVSSIAATFPDDPDYPYARTKRDAEARVRSGGVAHAVVRPTIVIGAEAPIWRRLRGLAMAPVLVVIGSGRARIQPVFVDDLAMALLTIVRRGAFDGATVELGGPEVLTMEAFLRRIRGILRGAAGPAVHLPYRPLRLALVGAERVLGAATPVRPGQLASFTCDGVATPNPLWEELRASMLGIDDMIRAAGGRG